VIGTGLLRKGKTPAGRSGRPRSCTIDSPPRESVVKTDDERVIYYVVDGDKAVQTPVKTGLRDGNLIEVEAEGLKSSLRRSSRKPFPPLRHPGRPRPLLPRDQPKNIAVRLMVRPGITGWAQVNGGAGRLAGFECFLPTGRT
jgi:Bacterial sugar transferase